MEEIRHRLTPVHHLQGPPVHRRGQAHHLVYLRRGRTLHLLYHDLVDKDPLGQLSIGHHRPLFRLSQRVGQPDRVCPATAGRPHADTLWERKRR